jgi:hypothetical protein
MSTEPSVPSTGSLAEARTEPLPGPAANPRRMTTGFWVIVGTVLLIFVVIVAIGTVIALSDDDDDDGDGDGADPDDHTVSAPIDGRDEAQLDLVSGATAVTVRAEAMGGTLLRVDTPPDGDSVPQVVDRGERIEVHLVPTGETGPSSVEVVLSTEVRWAALRFSGGADNQVLDLTGATIGEVDLAAGASRIQVTLPVPAGTVPIRLGAGAGELVLELPPRVPIQVTLHSGAGIAVIDGQSHSGVPSGTVFTPEDWTAAQDRYELDAASGIGQLTTTRTEA